MTGMNRNTGKAMSGLDHILQSVNDILTTPVGARLMRRDYGSDLPRLVDAPQNGDFRLRLCAATAAAIARWEKRIRLTRVQIVATAAEGRVSLLLTGVRLDLPQRPTFALPVTL